MTRGENPDTTVAGRMILTMTDEIEIEIVTATVRETVIKTAAVKEIEIAIGSGDTDATNTPPTKTTATTGQGREVPSTTTPQATTSPTGTEIETGAIEVAFLPKVRRGADG